MSECSKCGLPLQEGQDWCLQCGTGRPGSLSGGPGWRTGVAILGATALLAIGASVAAYAALNKAKPKPKVAVVAVSGAGTTSTPTATLTTPGATTPGATPPPGTPTTVKAAAPPKIPLQTPTPKSTSGANNEANNALFPPETKTTTTKTTSTATTPTKTTGESPESSKEGSGSGTKTGSESEAPSPILLDTNAASVYNPYAYPATLFGDPSLAIDGEEKTAWTAQVQAAVAPKMAEGLILDLKSPQKLGSVTVKTTTTTVNVEVYGALGKTPPASISDPGWKRLVGLKVLKKKSTALKLRTEGKGFRYIVLWLAKAPASSTAANPGAVAINEFELFPSK
ncbi:MAG TPA: hypothetical protein VNX67_06795 [Solirubrobacteraceae bacterium]|jgi:hypothetical protein|nr:hypothetical protein [Solirubrobacteraceae bacterium]